MNNRGHNILKVFDILQVFTSEAERDYFLKKWHIQITSRVVKQIKI